MQEGYLAGEYPGGTTTVEGAPVSATVLVYQRDSGQLIAQTESSQSGEWIVTGVDISKAHDIVGRKEGFNDVIVSNVMPTSMVDITYIDELLPNETFTGALGYIELVGGIPPYAASVVDPLPAGLFPVVNGRQLIIDGTTTDDDVFNSTVRITSSNGATKDVPVKLVVGFKAPANFEAETIEDAGTSSVVLTWEVTNSTQEVLVFKSATPFDLESMPAPIATLTGDAVSYTDDDVIEDDVFYYMAASVCEGFTLHSDEVREVVVARDPHWDKVVALLHFDGDFTDETGRSWTPSYDPVIGNIGVFGSQGCLHIPSQQAKIYSTASPVKRYDHFTMEAFVRFGDINKTLLLRPIFSQTDGGRSKQQSVSINTTTSRLQFHRQSGVGSVVTMDGVTTVSENTWHHVALSFDGLNIRLFLNGNLEATASNADGWYDVGQMEVGCYTNPSYTTYGFLGDIDEVRITKGVARYTENFTPPAEPFPNK